MHYMFGPYWLPAVICGCIVTYFVCNESVLEVWEFIEDWLVGQ